MRTNINLVHDVSPGARAEQFIAAAACNTPYGLAQSHNVQNGLLIRTKHRANSRDGRGNRSIRIL